MRAHGLDLLKMYLACRRFLTALNRGVTLNVLAYTPDE